jgi:hypothetical protein
MEGRPLLWRDKGCTKRNTVCWILCERFFFFPLIPLPMALNHRYALRLRFAAELQETVSTMLSL